MRTHLTSESVNLAVSSASISASDMSHTFSSAELKKILNEACDKIEQLDHLDKTNKDQVAELHSKFKKTKKQSDLLRGKEAELINQLHDFNSQRADLIENRQLLEGTNADAFVKCNQSRENLEKKIDELDTTIHEMQKKLLLTQNKSKVQLTISQPYMNKLQELEGAIEKSTKELKEVDLQKSIITELKILYVQLAKPINTAIEMVSSQMNTPLQGSLLHEVLIEFSHNVRMELIQSFATLLAKKTASTKMLETLQAVLELQTKKLYQKLKKISRSSTVYLSQLRAVDTFVFFAVYAVAWHVYNKLSFDNEENRQIFFRDCVKNLDFRLADIANLLTENQVPSYFQVDQLDSIFHTDPLIANENRKVIADVDAYYPGLKRAEDFDAFFNSRVNTCTAFAKKQEVINALPGKFTFQPLVAFPIIAAVVASISILNRFNRAARLKQLDNKFTVLKKENLKGLEPVLRKTAVQTNSSNKVIVNLVQHSDYGIVKSFLQNDSADKWATEATTELDKKAQMLRSNLKELFDQLDDLKQGSDLQMRHSMKASELHAQLAERINQYSTSLNELKVKKTNLASKLESINRHYDKLLSKTSSKSQKLASMLFTFDRSIRKTQLELNGLMGEIIMAHAHFELLNDEIKQLEVNLQNATNEVLDLFRNQRLLSSVVQEIDRYISSHALNKLFQRHLGISESNLKARIKSGEFSNFFQQQVASKSNKASSYTSFFHMLLALHEIIQDVQSRSFRQAEQVKIKHSRCVGTDVKDRGNAVQEKKLSTVDVKLVSSANKIQPSKVVIDHIY